MRRISHSIPRVFDPQFNMKQNLFLFSLLHVYFQVCVAEFSPLVELYQGKLRGTLKNDWKGGKFYSFLSIPYAAKPIGKSRFMPPQPAPKWDGIFDATEDMTECIQKDLQGKLIGQEDCLYLNVHTPEIKTKDLKPVMVNIHGGGYVEGHGRYDMFGPEFLIPEGVVLVTIQYRLGLLGFLNFENPNVGAPGNMGLKDQNFALQWVQKNIEKFGGDPKSVTILGESAGGASVHMHMLSPMSQGLFHKVIAQSGAALCPWNTNGQRNTGVFAAKHLDFKGKSETEMLSFLQDTPVENIFKVQENETIIIPIHKPFIAGPVVETSNDEHSFLPNRIPKLISDKNFNEVPFMLGVTDVETILLDVISLLKTGKTQDVSPEKTVLHTLGIQDEETKKEVADKISSFYYNNKDKSDRADFFDHTGDAWLNWGVYRTAIEHAKIGHKDLYLYLFSSDTKLNYFKRLHPTTAKYRGASHLDDLGYVFKTKYTPKIKPDSLEAKSLERVVKLWTNFAKYGNPTPKKDELNVTWKPFEENKLNFLNIGTQSLKMHKKFFANRMAFWDNLHEEYLGKKNVHTEL